MKKICAIIFFAITTTLHAQTYLPAWESLDSRPVPEWYRNGKFGIFIHWGVYSVPGYCEKGNYAEWYLNGLTSGDTARLKYHAAKFGDRSYYDLQKDFKAELFQPDEWAKVFERSGAKYIVLTSKHHDGFCLWPSKEASRDWGFGWNAVDAGPHRDLLGDLFAAVRKTSVHAGMYYSLYEWYNPLWLSDRNKYVQTHMWPQMKELVTKYQPDVFWTDGDWDATEDVWKSKEFLAWMYNESPVKNSIVTIDRWGSGVRFNHGAVYSPEYQPDVDFEDHYFEENRGMGFSYGYNREEDAWDYNSAQSLIIALIDKVSRGGNFLLDIGPDEHGKIPPIMQERLLQIGDWMKINNEAIYGTQRWRTPSQWSAGRRDYKYVNEHKTDDWKTGGDLMLKLTVDPDPGYAVKECFFTYNAAQNNLYALLPKWPSDKKFVIHDLQLKPDTKIELLETHQVLQWKQTGNNIEISFPEFDPNKIKSQHTYVVKMNNTGAFAAKPKIDYEYQQNAMQPNVTISSAVATQVRYTLDGSEPTENSMLYTKPFTVNNNATLKARAYSGNLLSSNIVTQDLKIFAWKPAVKAGTVLPGLQLQQYLLQSPKSVDELNAAIATNKKIAATVSISDTLRTENVGMKYNGYIKIPADGIYTFYLSSDDGSKLWLDDALLIDNDGLHGNNEKTETVALKKGFHSLQISFMQAGGGIGFSFKYSTNNSNKMDVPASMLFHKK